MDQEKAVDLMLTGKVTGVGLRDWSRIIAGQLGVSGWVRNNLDRTVSLHVEGPAEQVDSYVERLRRPNLTTAKVDDVEVRDAEYHGYSGFEVQY